MDPTEHGRATARALRDVYDQGAARLFEGLHLGDLAAFTSTVDHLIARIGQENC